MCCGGCATTLFRLISGLHGSLSPSGPHTFTIGIDDSALCHGLLSWNRRARGTCWAQHYSQWRKYEFWGRNPLRENTEDGEEDRREAPRLLHDWRLPHTEAPSTAHWIPHISFPSRKPSQNKRPVTKSTYLATMKANMQGTKTCFSKNFQFNSTNIYFPEKKKKQRCIKK